MVLSFLYAVILPIIMQRLEKYHFMQVGFSVFVFPPLTLSVYVCYQGFFFCFFCLPENHLSARAHSSDAGGRVVSSKGSQEVE